MTTSARFLVRSSAVPEPIEGKARCFDKLSNRKVQSSRLMVQGSYYNTRSIV